MTLQQSQPAVHDELVSTIRRLRFATSKELALDLAPESSKVYAYNEGLRAALLPKLIAQGTVTMIGSKSIKRYVLTEELAAAREALKQLMLETVIEHSVLRPAELMLKLPVPLCRSLHAELRDELISEGRLLGRGQKRILVLTANSDLYALSPEQIRMTYDALIDDSDQRASSRELALATGLSLGIVQAATARLVSQGKICTVTIGFADRHSLAQQAAADPQQALTVVTALRAAPEGRITRRSLMATLKGRLPVRVIDLVVNQLIEAGQVLVSTTDYRQTFQWTGASRCTPRPARSRQAPIRRRPARQARSSLLSRRPTPLSLPPDPRTVTSPVRPQPNPGEAEAITHHRGRLFKRTCQLAPQSLVHLDQKPSFDRTGRPSGHSALPRDEAVRDLHNVSCMCPCGSSSSAPRAPGALHHSTIQATAPPPLPQSSPPVKFSVLQQLCARPSRLHNAA